MSSRVISGKFRARRLVDELHGQKARVTFVHVETMQALVAERAQHPHAADAEDHLLAEPHAVIAAVEVIGEAAVALGVLGQVGVEQIHRHPVARDPGRLVAPCAQHDGAMLDLDFDAQRHLGEPLGDRPAHRLLGLVACRIEALPEIALVMDEGDRHERHAEIGGRTDGVAGKNAQAPRVRGNGVLERDLHREVRDCGRGSFGDVVASAFHGSILAFARRPIGPRWDVLDPDQYRCTTVHDNPSVAWCTIARARESRRSRRAMWKRVDSASRALQDS